jgi:hypothetical protein
VCRLDELGREWEWRPHTGVLCCAPACPAPLGHAACLQIKSVIVVILCIIIQFVALVWYTASYIPFAQDFLKRTVGSCFRMT